MTAADRPSVTDDARAEAWDEGWFARAQYDHTPDVDEPVAENPYRAAGRAETTAEQKVHNHGPTEGRGLDCPETTLPDGRLRGACLARAETTTALPRPGDGCQCTWHNEDRGGGHYELVAEYEPACPEHSEHVWNPRTGMWEHRADTTTATTEAEAGARAVSEMGDWFMQQGFDRDVTAAQACYERAARLRGGAR